MIKVNIREMAIKQGIKTAYQLEKVTGFFPSKCSYLWKGEWKRTDLNTLNTLCNVLKCTPSDILVFTPDPEEQI